MVGVTKIQRGNANYWIEAVAEGSEDYYTKPGESPGRWLGSQAAELGLSGEIDRDSYAAALAGQDPTTGEHLVTRPAPRTFIDAAGRERRAEPVLGFDVRFAAPKSVSLLYAVGSPDVRATITRAHDDAVAEAISYLEQNACFVSRGKGGARAEPGRGLLAMAFRHRSSRAGDPALHTHVLVANLTRAASDGRWLSLASPRRRSPLFHHAKPAGYVFQAAFRANVTRELGLQWQPVHNGYADLAGIERPVIDHFSQRRTEITEALAERGLASAKAAEVAAYRTRDAKDHGIDPDTRRAEWVARAAEFDLGPEEIDRQLTVSTPREPQPISPDHTDAALAELESHRSHFDRRDLLCALANQLPEGTGSSALAKATEGLLASGRLIEIHTSPDPLAPTFFTTPRLWALEQGFIESASRGQRAGVATVDERALSAILARHLYLGDDQLAMVRRLTTGGERIVAVAARPGTGKTTALAAAREAWEAAGNPVIGVASARSASGELTDAGIPGTSITALLIRAEEWEAKGVAPLDPGTVIVLDEASTASTPHLSALAELAEGCQGKLVAVGDPRQIGAVGPGGLYGHLTKTIEPTLLNEIRRQHDPSDRRIVELAHEGRGSDALDLLRTSERLRIADTLPETLDALALDWHRDLLDGADAVMIARRTRDVADLNARARDLLAAERLPGNPSIEVAGREFARGDRILTRINTHQVSNRERWEVTSVDPDSESIELTRIGGEERSLALPRSYLERTTPNGEPAIQHAYAMTAYATEAKTFDSAFVLLDPGISREEFLVEVSRARGVTTAYGVAALALTDPELGPGTRQIEDAAHELRSAAERPAADHPALEAEAQERVSELPAFELARGRAELRRRLSGESGPSPRQQRLRDLDSRIAKAEQRLADLDAAHDTLAAQRRPDRRLLGRLESDRRLSARQHDRLSAERRGLVGEIEAEEIHAADAEPRERLELALIEERLQQLCRREVAAERLQPSPLLIDTLGERPSDSAAAELWNEGVQTIHSYRRRHALSSTALPLGEPPRSQTGRVEWQLATAHLATIQQRLGIEPTAIGERSLSIEF